MNTGRGSNNKNIGIHNRALVLKLIATNCGMSRVELSRSTSLSKMAVGNIAGDLIGAGIIDETEDYAETTGSEYTSYGRKPAKLVLSEHAPCICGMLIKRGLCQVVIGSLDGKILDRVEHIYPEQIDGNGVISLLVSAFQELKNRNSRKIIAIGIASIGPLNSSNGIILNPPYFYGIENLPIVHIVQEMTCLPVYIVNDANAGALAEKLYGIGKKIPNFIYLHIMNGIGSGLVLENRLYGGDTGQSGEIGHTSITFSGPKCACGNIGCLDLFANHENVKKHIRQLSPLYPSSAMAQNSNPSWEEVVDAANVNDYLAISALEEFCGYISFALIDTLNLLDISHIIVGYSANSTNEIVEQILREKIKSSVLYSKYRELDVKHSIFGGDAPLIGSIALIAEKIFESELSVLVE